MDLIQQLHKGYGHIPVTHNPGQNMTYVNNIQRRKKSYDPTYLTLSSKLVYIDSIKAEPL